MYRTDILYVSYLVSTDPLTLKTNSFFVAVFKRDLLKDASQAESYFQCLPVDQKIQDIKNIQNCVRYILYPVISGLYLLD